MQNTRYSFVKWISHPSAALVAGILALAMVCFLTGCPPAGSRSEGGVIFQPATVHWSFATARRQVSLIPLPLDVPGPLAAVTLAVMNGPGTLGLPNMTLLAQRGVQTTATGPLADQLTGTPRMTSDNGSVLISPPFTGDAQQRTFQIPSDSHALFLQLDLPSTVDAGTYHVHVVIQPASSPAQAPAPIHADLQLNVSDITLPMEPPILAIATCTAAQLAQAHKTTFGSIQGQYLDRGEPDAARPLAQLDALVQAAHNLGICLYVQDLMPAVTVSEVGRVIIEWDAYDRTIGPYIDGTGFPDHAGNPVWLVPVPPRRVRDVPAQLRQYWQLCLDHAKDRGWAAAPALLHPALLDPAASPEAFRVALGVLRDNIPQETLVVAAPEIDIPQRRIWAVDDANPRLPATGTYATPQSVRIWPWMVKARNAAGLLWPNCLAAGPDSQNSALLIPTEPPAAVKDDKTPHPLASSPDLTLRAAWLTAGLNDVAHLALLEKRSDPARAAEVLAAIAGRTGLADVTPVCPDETWKSGRQAALYALWPASAETWDLLDGRIDQLVIAAAPGAAVKIAEDDPAYLQTKIWLAKAHQLIGQVSGYRFDVSPGRDGAALRLTADLLIENPINMATPIALHVPELPGDYQPADLKDVPVAPYAVTAYPLTLQGHLDMFSGPQAPLPLTLREKNGGVDVEVPVPLPVFKIRATHEPPKIDAKRKDWLPDTFPFVTMPVDLRYLSRPDVLAGKVRRDAAPATVRWCYDAENIYALLECPQAAVDDQRNNDWPEENGRWWGTDGLQIHLAGGPRMGEGNKVIEIAIKPSGSVLTRQAVLQKGQPVQFTDGPAGIRYSIHADGNGYVAQVAIPRRWFGTEHGLDPATPVWRVNVLRYVHQTQASTSWSGPVRSDADFSMMGLLVGVGE